MANLPVSRKYATATVLFLAVLMVSGVTATTNIISLDGDELPLMEEIRENTDPLAADTDSDGLRDDMELEEGTDPTRADSDSDGLEDGDELDRGTDPLESDTDSDGLNDGDEIDRETDPLEKDTDSDNLQDGKEVEIGTDPTRIDTDDDLLNDSYEYRELGTDPVSADTDGEGLNDSEELDQGTDPLEKDTDEDNLDDFEEVYNYSSDPLKSDTDGDGLDDGEEIKRGLEPDDPDTDDDGLDDYSELQEGTDPDDADTDDDGLGDGTEIEEGTDPLQKDTDEDGLDDFEEVVNYPTFPDKPDSDSDGLKDGAEVKLGALDGSDPMKRDVFVEVDYMPGQRPSDRALDMVKDAFAQSPVLSPGGEGIDLHILVDEEIEQMDTVDSSEQNELMEEYFDREGKGYHHAIAVDNAELNGEDAAGFGSPGEFVFQTEFSDGTEYPDDYQADLFMHEMGHSLGLGSDTYTGIDSEEVPYSEYSSVLNYNAPAGTVRYSDGGSFDDWDYLQSNMHTPYVSAP